MSAIALPSSTLPVILIVDDEEANVRTFGRSFRKEMIVRTATSVERALEELERAPIDLVLTDYKMPHMNGIELLRVVAARWPETARVLVTGHADLDELQEACRSGLAAELVAKPWRRLDMLELVGRLVARSAP